MVQPLWRTVWRVFKNLKVEFPYDPIQSLLDISEESSNLKRCVHFSVHCSSIYNSQDMEATEMSINR